MTYLAETNIGWSFKKKLLPSLKLLAGVYFKDLNWKDQIILGAKNSILAALEYLLEQNSVGTLPQFGSCYA